MMFFERLSELSVDASSNDFFDSLCALWYEEFQASWVHLWLKNEETINADIVSVIPAQPYSIPAALVAAPGSAVVESMRRPGFWKTTLEDYQQKLRGKNEALIAGQAGASSEDSLSQEILLVPLHHERPALRNSGDETSLFVEGTIAVGLPKKMQSDFLSGREVAALGRVTAGRIVDAYQSQQLKILMELNTLARQFLPSIGKHPVKHRSSYLLQVANIVRNAIHASNVDVYYESFFGHMVECLHSDGVLNETKEAIQRNALGGSIQFSEGEGKVGSCYCNNKPISINLDKSKEEPRLIYPIPPSPDQSERACGVLDCRGRKSRFDSSLHQSFSTLEIQTLGFVCQQIAPVLEVLAERIQRENQISIIKHDLLVPAGMMHDTVEKLKRRKLIAPEAGYASDDLNMATRMVINLTNQLDADPTEIKVRKRPTYLMGEVVARSISLLRHYANVENEMSIEFSGFDTLPMLMVDSELIERVLYNLITNAVKYGTRGSAIEVIAGNKPAHYYIDVVNEGIGVLPEEKALIFRRNYQSRRARKLKVGAGLGLTISKAAMQLQKADLVLYSDILGFLNFLPHLWTSNTPEDAHALRGGKS